MRLRNLKGCHLLNQNQQCAEAAEGLSADSPEDGSDPDFALRATVVGAGRSKGMIFACVEGSGGMVLEDKTILRTGSLEGKIIVRTEGLKYKIVPRARSWGGLHHHARRKLAEQDHLARRKLRR